MTKEVEFNKQFANEIINKEFNIGEEKKFFYKESNSKDWKITIRREEDIYLPFLFALEAEKIGTNETFSRRYIGIKEAILHIVNDFNENSNIKNKYSDIDEYLNEDLEVTKIKKNSRRFDYMMLDRLRSECDTYLRTGDVYDLYYRAVGSQIEEMKRIYNSFSKEEKPEWINLEDIDNYCEKMIQVLVNNWKEEFEESI